MTEDKVDGEAEAVMRLRIRSMTKAEAVMRLDEDDEASYLSCFTRYTGSTRWSCRCAFTQTGSVYTQVHNSVHCTLKCSASFPYKCSEWWGCNLFLRICDFLSN